ncbi:RNA polymerase sigma factor RpoD/SigA, partial [Nanoarchaeota archaeon]
ENARKKVFESNMRLVVYFAKNYSRTKNMDFLDIIQEGNLGLNTAINKFDYRLGNKFSTYATWWIKQAINRSIAEKRDIRTPIHITEEAINIGKTYQFLFEKNNRKPTDMEIMDFLSMDKEKYFKLKNFYSDAVSLDAPINGTSDEDSDTLLSFIEDDKSEKPSNIKILDLKIIVDKLFQRLNDREKMIIKLRFGFENNMIYTLEKVAKLEGVSKGRIREIETRALYKMRTSNLVKLLDNYKPVEKWHFR